MKKPDYYRSVFFVTVEDTNVFLKEDGIGHLMTLNNIAGINISVEQKGDNKFRVISRSSFLRYSLLDYDYIKNNLIRNYGNIDNEYLSGRIVERRKFRWINFRIDKINKVLVAIDEWEKIHTVDIKDALRR